MTSVPITGLKRSNVCGDGYRIEGALLMSHPYSKSASYSPYEDCYMTFKVEIRCSCSSRENESSTVGSSSEQSNTYSHLITRSQ